MLSRKHIQNSIVQQIIVPCRFKDKIRKSIFRFFKRRISEASARRIVVRIYRVRYALLPIPYIRVDIASQISGAGTFLRGRIIDPKQRITTIELFGEKSKPVVINDCIEYFDDDVTLYKAELKRLGLPSGFTALVPSDYAQKACNTNDANTEWEPTAVRFTLSNGLKLVRKLRLTDPSDNPLDHIRQILQKAPRQSERKKDLFDRVYGPVIQSIWSLRNRQAPAADLVRYNAELATREPDVSLIIPIYGRYDFIEHQLSLFADDKDMQRHELLYIIDDPRIADEVRQSAETLSRIYSIAFQILYLEKNLGYSGANNMGVAHASSCNILLLNSDVMPGEHGWLRRLRELVGDDINHTITGARLLYEDQSVQHDGMRFVASPFVNNLWTNTHPGKGLPVDLFDSKNDLVECEAVTGACMLLTRENYLAAGGLNENFILGDFEDSDLCMAARKLGLKIQVAGQINLYHLERQSQSLVSAERWKNELTYYNCWQHHQKWDADIQNLKRSGTHG